MDGQAKARLYAHTLGSIKMVDQLQLLQTDLGSTWFNTAKTSTKEKIKPKHFVLSH